MADSQEATLLRDEFNRWAEAGRGEEMEDHHRPIVEPTLELIPIQIGDSVLDVGCGSGWLCREIARRAPSGHIVGMDVSDEMIRRARKLSENFRNTTFIEGTAENIPWSSGFFAKAISVESAYYWPKPAAGLREMLRVLAPGGSAWILINYYHDNPYCHQWGPILQVPTHLLSAAEWMQQFTDAGFVEVFDRRIPDRSPTPEVYEGRWFRNAEEMSKFKALGALLVSGKKPAEHAVI